MDGLKTLPKRSATSKEMTETLPNALRIPKLLSRYSTRLPAESLSPEPAVPMPVYSPAPKPSQLLLDYLNSSSSKTPEHRSPQVKKLQTLKTPSKPFPSRLISSKSLKTITIFDTLKFPSSATHLQVPNPF
jgi:hypothetical protein